MAPPMPAQPAPTRRPSTNSNGPGRVPPGTPPAVAGGQDAGGAAAAGDADPAFRHAYTRDRAQLLRRLRRIEGQVRGIARMVEREEYCVDILQQTSALRAAVDAVAILILEDHVQGCVRTAAERGDADRYVEEVLDVVRRSLGRPIRTGSRG
jgi:CsoR family transcriptional regulator, copper-sensing transcriptional repressor